MNDDALPAGQMLIYATPDGKARIQVELADESMWLSQAHIAELFRTTQLKLVSALWRGTDALLKEILEVEA